jgi:hypothetical protein
MTLPYDITASENRTTDHTWEPNNGGRHYPRTRPAHLEPPSQWARINFTHAPSIPSPKHTSTSSKQDARKEPTLRPLSRHLLMQRNAAEHLPKTAPRSHAILARLPCEDRALVAQDPEDPEDSKDSHKHANTLRPLSSLRLPPRSRGLASHTSYHRCHRRGASQPCHAPGSRSEITAPPAK